jgi:hypothetical protein
VARSGDPNRPNYLNHFDAPLRGDLGLNRRKLVRDAAVVQICGTNPRDGSDWKRYGSGNSGRDTPGVPSLAGRQRIVPPSLSVTRASQRSRPQRDALEAFYHGTCV